MNYKQSFLTKEDNIAYKMTTAIYGAVTLRRYRGNTVHSGLWPSVRGSPPLYSSRWFRRWVQGSPSLCTR